jgi:hypothetical protein
MYSYEEQGTESITSWNFVGHLILNATTMKNIVSQNATPCSLVNHCFKKFTASIYCEDGGSTILCEVSINIYQKTWCYTQKTVFSKKKNVC